MSQSIEAGHDKFVATRKQVGNFVGNDLIEQEGISTAVHKKAIAYSEDLIFVLSRLYSANYLNTFTSMRAVLNLTIY